MPNVIPLLFADFRRVCDEHGKRIYYYQSGDTIDLYFISEGMFVWSYLNIDSIPNKEAFFSQKMFMGAVELLFKIPVRDESSVDRVLVQPLSIIKENEPVENNPDADLQKDNIDPEPEGV